MVWLYVVGWLVCGVITWLFLMRECIKDCGYIVHTTIQLIIPCMVVGLAGLMWFGITLVSENWYDQIKDWLTRMIKKTIRVNQTGIEPSDLDSSGSS